MLFREVLGQERLKAKLRGSVHGRRVAHAQMLLGTSGSGSLALALAYAQFLACTDRGEEDSCGACSSCRRYAKLEHPDLQLIFPKNKTDEKEGTDFSSKDFVIRFREAVIDNPYLGLQQWLQTLGIENKQGTINVHDSREILANLSYKAYEAEYRVVIVWLAEHMNTASANKLLKVLEEPPERTVFLFTSDSTENMLATILSRVQTHRLDRLKEEMIVEGLRHMGDGDEEQLRLAAHLADGDFGLALQLMRDKDAAAGTMAFFISWMRASFLMKMDTLSELMDTFQKMGRERQKDLLAQAAGLLRNVLMYRMHPQGAHMMSRDQMEFVQKFSKFISVDNMEGLLSELDRAHYHIERNAHPKILFTDLSYRISGLLQQEALKG
jgi:DNA polymerase III subunit delta'